MIKMEFYSKDWPIISKSINNDYLESRFLYINAPNLLSKKTYLLIRYIGDDNQFNEMISKFKEKGIVVTIKEEI